METERRVPVGESIEERFGLLAAIEAGEVVITMLPRKPVEIPDECESPKSKTPPSR